MKTALSIPANASLSKVKEDNNRATKQKRIQARKVTKSSKFKELDIVEIKSDQIGSPFKKGMKATVLDIFPGDPDSLVLEVIEPSIINSVASDRVKAIE